MTTGHILVASVALVAALSATAVANQPDWGFGPVNTSDPEVKAVCKDTTLTLVGSRFINEEDSSEHRRAHGVRIKTASGLYLVAYALQDEQTDWFSSLKVGQRVQACLTMMNLQRRGGESNRFCVHASYRFYDYDLERIFVFGNNGCHL